MRDELLELYVIFQARVLHVRDASGWRHVFDKSVQRLLSIKPLQSLTKVGVSCFRTLHGTTTILLRIYENLELKMSGMIRVDVFPL